MTRSGSAAQPRSTLRSSLSNRRRPAPLIAVDAIGFFDWDAVNDRMTWERGTEARFGVPPGSIAHFSAWSAFIEPADLARFHAQIAAAADAHSDRIRYGYRFCKPDGETLLVEGIALCQFDNSSRLERMFGVWIDVTSDEAARQALGRHKTQLRSIIETVPDAVLVISGSGVIRDLNAPAEAMFGIPRRDAIGTDATRFIPWTIDDKSAPETSAARLLRRFGTVNARRSTGVEFPAEVSIGAATFEGEQLLTAIVRDISERIEDAQRLESLQNQYLRTARLNAMGAVAAGLAHELNQPLAAGANFLAAARLMIDAGKPIGEVVAMLEEAQAQIAQAGDIIRGLRGFLSRAPQPSTRLSIPQLVDQAAGLTFIGRDRAEIVVRCLNPEATPPIFADRVEALQVLVNLFRNAAEAIGGQSEKTITVAATRVGQFAHITVTDNGPGFDMALIDSFDRGGVSTKGVDNMGFGLSICQRIVETWGGRIEFSNAAKGGAVISFTVPLADKE